MSYFISPHTLQMNAWIGLCQLDDRFPDTLAKLGYGVDIIEPSIRIDGDPIRPDLVITAPRRIHSLLLDFKSASIKDHQNERYQSAVENPNQLVLRGAVQGVPPDQLDADFSYSSFRDLTQMYDLSEFPFMTLHFEAHIGSANLRIEIVDGDGFGVPELDNAFPIEVSRGQDIPTDHYPFDAEEEDFRQFTIYMLNSAVKLAGEYGTDPFSVDELLKESHKLWESMSDGKKQELRALGEKFVDEYQKKGLDEHLRKVQKEGRAAWFHKSGSYQALRKRVDGFVKHLEGELRQRDITDF